MTPAMGSHSRQPGPEGSFVPVDLRLHSLRGGDGVSGQQWQKGSSYNKSVPQRNSLYLAGRGRLPPPRGTRLWGTPTSSPSTGSVQWEPQWHQMNQAGITRTLKVLKIKLSKRKKKITSVSGDVEKLGPSYVTGRMENGATTVQNWFFDGSSKS